MTRPASSEVRCPSAIEQQYENPSYILHIMQPVWLSRNALSRPTELRHAGPDKFCDGSLTTSLWAGKPPQYLAVPDSLTQPSILHGPQDEY